MKPLRVVMLVLALSLLAAPARAAVIGLLGGDYDPQSIFDPTFNSLSLNCDPEGAAITGLPLGYFCALYEIFSPEEAPPYYAPFVVNSIDFRLLDEFGGYFSTTAIGETLFAAGEGLNDLGNLAASELFPGGITFRLSGGSISCPFYCAATFFSDSASVAKVSIVAVNDVASVPEPATLLLLGPAFAALMARRKWARRGTSSLTRSAGTSSPVA